MQPCPASWLTILVLVFGLQVFIAEAVWQDKAWVRKYPCGQLRRDFPSEELTPFWIDSLRGLWNTTGDSTELRLDILAVHNKSLIACESIDVSLLEGSLEFQVLGHPVGGLEKFWSECPLPITETLTPIGNHRLCSYHLIYTFQSTHRLQTLVSTFRFSQLNGTELDCGVAKITPDIGKSASAAFTFTPASVLALVAFSSLWTHLNDLGSGYIIDHGSVLVGQGPLWATVLDVTGYLRHLQFIFISASMTIEYPNFYVPAVSKLAWASLLYWRGPIDKGHSNKGIDGGIYVGNASYGLENMTQVLGYPNMLNTLANSLINFVMVVAPIFFVILVLSWRASTASSFWSTTKKAAGMTIGMALCFFSVPLLSYMAYDLVLIGYLPNYRIVLAVLMLLIIIGVNHFLAHSIVDDQLRCEPTSTPTQSCYRIQKVIFRHLPHTLPLLQAIGVGSLQACPAVQLSVLAAIECLLLAIVLKEDRRFFTSTAVYCSAARLLTIFMTIVCISSAAEASKQWAGYAMLVLHGLVVLPVFFIKSVGPLYRTIRRRKDNSQEGPSSKNHATSNRTTAICMNYLPSPPSSNTTEYRKGHSRESPSQHENQNLSSFYRPPRSRTITPIPQAPQPMLASDIPIMLAPVESIGDTQFDLDLALSQVSPRVGVDYSFRESDLVYGRPVEGSSSTTIFSPDSDLGHDQSSESGFFKNQKLRIFTNLRRLKRTEQEKGFVVIRQPRPP